MVLQFNVFLRDDNVHADLSRRLENGRRHHSDHPLVVADPEPRRSLPVSGHRCRHRPLLLHWLHLVLRRHKTAGRRRPTRSVFAPDAAGDRLRTFDVTAGHRRLGRCLVVLLLSDICQVIVRRLYRHCDLLIGFVCLRELLVKSLNNFFRANIKRRLNLVAGVLEFKFAFVEAARWQSRVNIPDRFTQLHGRIQRDVLFFDWLLVS